MIQGIGGEGSLARAALEAALKSQSQAAAKVEDKAEALGGKAREVGFERDLAKSLSEGLRAVDGELKAADHLPLDMVAGKVTDFHEVAAKLKDAELTFRFAMEVRNKLIDAYRETMRMSV